MADVDNRPVIKVEPGLAVGDDSASGVSISHQDNMAHSMQSSDSRSGHVDQMAILQQQLSLTVNAQHAEMHPGLVMQQGGIAVSTDALAQSVGAVAGMYTTASPSSLTASGEYVIPGTSLLQAGQGFIHVPVMPEAESSGATGDMDSSMMSSRQSQDELREQDRFLPIANVARIMKKGIPENGKIAKDAKECVQECVSEFISFITSEASERCHQEKRKTINGEDILCAMQTLGFDNYVEPLKVYLSKYREAIKGEKMIGIEFTSDVGVTDEEQQATQYHVVTGTLHPGIVSGGIVVSDGSYTYSAGQLQQGNLHFA